jgi:rubrerythrin
MPNTNDNLQAAFAGESQASRKYLFFSEKADADGQPQIAKLFRAASEAETVHARNHLNALNGIGSAADNLKASIEGEHYEFTDMYPEFIGQADKEQNSKATQSFNWANKVEQIHHGLYQQSLKDLETGIKKEAGPFYVCQRCGNTVEGEAPDKCPVCGAPRTMFKRID